MKFVAAFAFALLFSISSAQAEDRAISDSGHGADKASACQSAKTGVEFKVNLIDQTEHNGAHITRYSDCDCSYAGYVQGNETMSWTCTVNAEYHTNN